MWERWLRREVGSRGGSSCVAGISLPEETWTLVLRCENSPSSETPGIPRPPKGGHPGNLGGTHSSQSLGSKNRGTQGEVDGGGVWCWSLEH